MGDERSGLNVPLVALQATEHLEGMRMHFGVIPAWSSPTKFGSLTIVTTAEGSTACAEPWHCNCRR